MSGKANSSRTTIAAGSVGDREAIAAALLRISSDTIFQEPINESRRQLSFKAGLCCNAAVGVVTERTSGGSSM